MKRQRYTHTFGPLYNKDSKILIVGTFPSVKSREGEFYYHHPMKRFWKVISRITGCHEPVGISEKKEMLLKNRIALWDVVKTCDIEGSSDSSIRNVVPNDIGFLLDNSKIDKIYANGNKAFELYNTYCFSKIGKKAVRLPSTSPANAAYSLNKLVGCWESIIFPDRKLDTKKQHNLY